MVSVGNPTLWFASVLRNRLIASGHRVTGEAVDIDDVMPPPTAGHALFTHRRTRSPRSSQPLLKESINLYGEAVMRLNAGAGRSRRTMPRSTASASGWRPGEFHRTASSSSMARACRDGT